MEEINWERDMKLENIFFWYREPVIWQGSQEYDNLKAIFTFSNSCIVGVGE